MKITNYSDDYNINLSGGNGVATYNSEHVSLGSNTPLVESGSGAPGSGPQASAWDHVHPAFGSSSAFGSNSSRVAAVSSAGASSSNSRADHVHDGIGTATASSSNTLNRGNLNLRAGTGIALGLSNTDGGTGFDTVTIQNIAAASGGGTVSYGSNSTRVAASPAAGASTLVSRVDHVHDGVRSVAKSGSSQLVGDVTLTGGTNVTLTQSGNDISIASTGGVGGTITTKDEGSTLSTSVTTLDFVGAGVSAAGAGATTTVTIPGSSAGTTRTPVQNKTQNGSTSTNSLALTLGSTPTNGNLLILVSGRDDNGTISSITQTNVVWTQLATSTAAPRVEVWKGVVSASASTSITVAYSTSTFSQYVVSEWNGVTGTIDTTAVISGSTTIGGYPQTPTITPTIASALVVGGATTTSNGSAYVPYVISTSLIAFDTMLLNTMRMFACYGGPGTQQAKALGPTLNTAQVSGVLVSIT